MKDSVKSVVVITLICLIVAAALGVTNYFTAPVIEKGAAERASALCKELIPEADDFKELDVNSFEDLPETVSAVYMETNGLGYVFQITTKGYDSGLVVMCAVSANDGTVISTSTLSNNETPTIGGSKVLENKEYTSQYIGKNISSLDGIDAVSGATYTADGYKSAVRDALNAFAVIAIGEE